MPGGVSGVGGGDLIGGGDGGNGGGLGLGMTGLTGGITSQPVGWVEPSG